MASQKELFEKWFNETAKKSNGEPYKKDTIRDYKNAIDDINEKYGVDVYSFTDYTNFEKENSSLRGKKGFKEFSDSISGNPSAALSVYGEFLKYQEAPITTTDSINKSVPIYFRVNRSALNSFDGAMGEFSTVDGNIKNSLRGHKTKVYANVPLLKNNANNPGEKHKITLNNIAKKRESLAKEGYIDEHHTHFTKEYEKFKSPNEAGMFIAFSTLNKGNTSNDKRHSDLLYSKTKNGPFLEFKQFVVENPTFEQDIELIDPDYPQEKKDKNPHNIILYGPPGTGKTYNSMIYAVKLCAGESVDSIRKGIENKEYTYENTKAIYKELVNNNQISFVTFHQSYGYEEFIEGIKPIVEEDKKQRGSKKEKSENLVYKKENGCFKEFCLDKPKQLIERKSESINVFIKDKPSIYKVSLASKQTIDNEIKEECFEKNHIRIGHHDKDDSNQIVKCFKENMEIGDIVVTNCSEKEIDAIGVIDGGYEWHDEYTEYKRFRSVKWIVKNIKEDISDIIGKEIDYKACYCMDKLIGFDQIKRIIEKHKEPTSYYNRVFIIDEINRGNISKIFGELITLIEDSKREGKDECIPAILPYTKEQFSVPDNVYILGTMNTADRSIALLDTALRRRFQFVEMMPEPEKVLGELTVEKDGNKIEIKEMLEMINKRIEVLYDREHTIGHAYFCDLLKKDDDGNGLSEEEKFKMLKNTFRNKIIPLLQEYFYDDYEKIRLVLGDNQKENTLKKDYKNSDKELKEDYKGKTTEYSFIKAEEQKSIELFGDGEYEDKTVYKINTEVDSDGKSAFDNAESYIGIYNCLVFEDPEK